MGVGSSLAHKVVPAQHSPSRPQVGNTGVRKVAIIIVHSSSAEAPGIQSVQPAVPMHPLPHVSTSESFS
jgi:hypothetical protein